MKWNMQSLGRRYLNRQAFFFTNDIKHIDSKHISLIRTFWSFSSQIDIDLVGTTPSTFTNRQQHFSLYSIQWTSNLHWKWGGRENGSKFSGKAFVSSRTRNATMCRVASRYRVWEKGSGRMETMGAHRQLNSRPTTIRNQAWKYNEQIIFRSSVGVSPSG